MQSLGDLTSPKHGMLPWKVVTPLFLLAIASFACLLNLGKNSINHWNKETHLLVAQNTHHSAHWWTPMQESPRIPMDYMHEALGDVTRALSAQGKKLQVFTTILPKFDQTELPYLRPFLPYGTPASEFDAIAQSIRSGTPTFVLVGLDDINAFFDFTIPNSYIMLPTLESRTIPMAGLLFNISETPKHFLPNKTLVPIKDKESIGAGWGKLESIGRLAVRRSFDKKASLLVRTTKITKRRPTHLYLNLTPQHPSKRRVKVFIHVNDRFVGELNMRNNSLQTYDLAIPAGAFIPGLNSLMLTPEDGAPMLGNWVSLHLR